MSEMRQSWDADDRSSPGLRQDGDHAPSEDLSAGMSPTLMLPCPGGVLACLSHQSPSTQPRTTHQSIKSSGGERKQSRRDRQDPAHTRCSENALDPEDRSSGTPRFSEAQLLTQHLRPPQMAPILSLISKHQGREGFSWAPSSPLTDNGYLKDGGCYRGLDLPLPLTHAYTLLSCYSSHEKSKIHKDSSLKSCYRHH